MSLYAKTTSSGSGSGGGGGGTVTSVGLADGSSIPIYNISGSPVTGSGTLVFTLSSQTQNQAFLSPNGSSGQPGFRAIVSADLASATGNLTDVGTDGIVITGGSGAVIGSGTSIAQHVADTTHNGYLASADWNTFNAKQAALTFTDSLVNSANTVTLVGDTLTPGNSMYYGTNGSGTRGWYSSVFGTVTSVGFSVPASSLFSVSGSPVTSSGTLALSTTGTSGGIPYFSSTSQLNSSGLLTASQLVLGGGAGSAPTTLAAGSQYNVLVMGASNPGYGQVALNQTAAVTGTLPVGNGGTGQISLTNHGVLVGAGTSGITQLAAAATGTVLTGQGASADPAFSATPSVTSITANDVVVNGSSSGAVTIQGPTTVTPYSLTLPPAQGGSNTFLENDGSGILSWGTVSSSIAISSKTSNYIATTSDGLILCSGSAFTVTLPAASNAGFTLRIQKTDASFANIITIATAGSDTIQGGSTTTLNTQYEEIVLVADGNTTWYVQSRNYPEAWQTYTPSIGAGLGTVSGAAGVYRRIGDSLQVIASWTNGTVAASAATITIPSGLAINSAKLTLNNTTANPGNSIGFWTHNGGANEFGNLVTAPATSTALIYFGTSTTVNGMLVSQNGSAIMTSGNVVSAQFTVPISGWN